MATFAPKVPFQGDQNYLSGVGPHVSGGETESKGAEELKGLTNTLKEASTVYDTTGKEMIRDEDAQWQQQHSQEFIDAVSKLHASVKGGSAGAAEPDDSGDTDDTAYNADTAYSAVGVAPVTPPGTDIVQPEEQPKPPGIDQGIQRVAQVQKAYQAGTISMTQMLMEKDKHLKDMRARYPGFTDYVDRTVGDPANQMVRQMLSDINAQQKTALAEKNKQLTFIRQNSDFDGASQMYKDVDSGKASGQDVIDWAARNNAGKHRLEVAQREAALDKATQPVVVRAIKITADKEATSAWANLPAINAGTPENPKMITIDDVMQRKVIPTPEIAAQFLQAIDAGITTATVNTQRYLSTPGKDGKTPRQKIVDGDANKMVEDSMISLTTAKDMLSKGSWAPLNAMKTAIDQTKDNDLNGIYQSGSTPARVAREFGALNAAAGGKAEVLTNIITHLNGIVIGDKETQSFNDSWNRRIATQGMNYADRVQQSVDNFNPTKSDAGVSPTPFGLPPITFNTVADEHRRFASANERPIPPRANEATIETLRLLEDTSTPEGLRVGVATAAFDPTNANYLNNYKQDYKDPVTGKVSRGQTYVYNRMTSPATIKGMQSLSASHPDLWNNFVNWTRNSYGSTLLLRELHQFADLSKDKDVEISYDPDTAHWSARNKGRANVAVRSAQGMFDRINAASDGLKRVADAAGLNANLIILQQAMQAGLQIDPDSVTGHMIQALIHSGKSVPAPTKSNANSK